MKKKKLRLNNFAKFLCIYSGVIVVIIIVLLVMLNGLLKDYEEGRPSSAMDKIISQLTSNQIGQLVSEATTDMSEFETTAVVEEYLKNKVDNTTVYYKKKCGVYSEETPVYVIYADDTPIAQVNLEENGKNAHKFTTWKLGTISFEAFEEGDNQIEINVPTGSVVQLNGVEINESYITESNVTFSPCENVSSYVTTPTMTTYTVGGLLVQPEVTVEYNGVQLEVTNEKNTYTAAYPSDEELLESERSYIANIAESYGKYIINRGSMETLTKYMTGKAKEYVSNIPAIWAFLYGKTYTYEFQNESVSNLVKYSDSCFSCDIYYDLYVDWTSGNKTYNTAMTYTFVKTNGTWYVADFTLN